MPQVPANTPYEITTLQDQFDEPESTRTGCPLCQDDGFDTQANNLKIGSQRVWCFRDETHGRELYKHLAPPLPDTLPPALPANDEDPHGAFFDTAYPENGAAYQKPVRDANTLHLEFEIILRAAADDLGSINIQGLERLFKESMKMRHKNSRENYALEHLMGRIMRELKALMGAGGWYTYLDEDLGGMNKDWAARCMRIAKVPWTKACRFKSSRECTEYLRGKKPAKPNRKQVLIIAQEKEIESLKGDLKKAGRPSKPDPRIERVEQEKRAAINRSTDAQRKVRELEASNADLQASKNALQNSYEKLENQHAKTCIENADLKLENGRLKETLDGILEAELNGI